MPVPLCLAFFSVGYVWFLGYVSVKWCLKSHSQQTLQAAVAGSSVMYPSCQGPLSLSSFLSVLCGLPVWHFVMHLLNVSSSAACHILYYELLNRPSLLELFVAEVAYELRQGNFRAALEFDAAVMTDNKSSVSQPSFILIFFWFMIKPALAVWTTSNFLHFAVAGNRNSSYCSDACDVWLIAREQRAQLLECVCTPAHFLFYTC